MPKPIAGRIPKWCVVVASCLCLAACAGTKVRDVVAADPVASSGVPHTVAVIVDNDSTPPEKASRQARQAADAEQSVADLASGLNDMLSTHRLAVVRPGDKSDLILHCRITDVRGGNQLVRLLVGYGAGKAVLRMHVTLDDAAGHTLLSFDTRSTTGAGKGAALGLDGGAVAAVKTGVGGARGLKKDLPHEIAETTEHIDEEMGKYFVAHQWSYPAADAIAAR